MRPNGFGYIRRRGYRPRLDCRWAGLDVIDVSRYDAKEDADALGEVRLLQSLGLDANSTVLDLGARIGQFTLAVARICSRVVAADVSPVMQERLAGKVEASGHGNIEYVSVGFLTYQHSREPVDFAYSRYAPHHLPDFWNALALVRLAGFMRPGAVLRLWDVVYSFQPAEAEERIESRCATGGSDMETDWSRAALEEHVRDEHSTFTWLLEPIIERAGFRIDDADTGGGHTNSKLNRLDDPAKTGTC